MLHKHNNLKRNSAIGVPNHTQLKNHNNKDIFLFFLIYSQNPLFPFFCFIAHRSEDISRLGA